jgi:hypothetical protein
LNKQTYKGEKAMKKRINMKLWNHLRNLALAGVVVAFFVSVAPVVSHGADRLLVKDGSEVTKFVVTDAGFLGSGTAVPVRQLHVAGDQAVFRMDRPYDTAAFMLVRTDVSGNPLKTFVVGANASGSNTGEFVINDLGAAVAGAGTRRMTISNSGSVNFPGAVTAASFTPVSSIVHKTNVKTYENALETVKKLRGVRFDWKDSGKPSVGLIAEEVDKVIPEVVAHDEKAATGLNYDSLVGVLVEAVKEQEKTIQAQQRAIQELQEQQKINAALSVKVSELERLLILSNAVSKAD